MIEKIVKWVDPFTSEPLKKEGSYLSNSSSKYKLTDGIPSFVHSISDLDQNQVKTTFSYKWTRSDFGQKNEEFNAKIRDVYLDMLGLDEKDLSLFFDKVVLDVGVGSGSSARLWAKNAKEFHGIDISEAVFKANNALKNLKNPPILSQANLFNLPYLDEQFDVIVSNGVLHHTRSTKEALKAIIKKLKTGGHCLFYVYKKKSPIREFSDDYIRSKISDMPPDEAWKYIEEITKFSKAIHDQSIKINIPDNVKLLDINKGEYDLKQFIYQHFFKCFWNETWGFEDSNMVNFDWYYPKYSWRQTEEEIKNWCNEFHLKIEYLKERESGYTCLVEKN